MIGSRVLEHIDQLSSRKFADDELLSDLSFIKDELLKAYQSLNSFDEYASEIKSGKLRWSPPHTSELFWQDNAGRLEDSDNDLLKQLCRLLSTSSDPLVLAVVANDLGEYVNHRPAGKRFFIMFNICFC